MEMKSFQVVSVVFEKSLFADNMNNLSMEYPYSVYVRHTKKYETYSHPAPILAIPFTHSYQKRFTRKLCQ